MAVPAESADQRRPSEIVRAAIARLEAIGPSSDPYAAAQVATAIGTLSRHLGDLEEMENRPPGGASGALADIVNEQIANAIKRGVRI